MRETERLTETVREREMQKVTSQNTGEYQLQTKVKNMLNKGREGCHLGREDNPRNTDGSFL